MIFCTACLIELKMSYIQFRVSDTGTMELWELDGHELKSQHCHWYQRTLGVKIGIHSRWADNCLHLGAIYPSQSIYMHVFKS